MVRSMRAVIMAGGEGTRLRPLTSNQPKPMVSLCGKPCMEYIIELLRRHGIEETVVTLMFMPKVIRDAFGDGADLGVSIRYSVEETPAGTAGSVKLAEDYLKGGTFIVISGDALTDLDLSRALTFHKQRGAMATIALKRVENPLEFGVVVTDDEGRIQRFLEKPTWGQVFSDTVNTGIYILEPEIFDHIPPETKYDFSQELFPKLFDLGAPSTGMSPTTTGRTSGASSSTLSPTETSSTARWTRRSPASSSRTASSWGRASTSIPSTTSRGPPTSAITPGSPQRRS